MVRNEGRDILEWVAFHRVIGFDTFIVLDNKSTDRTTEILREASASLDIIVIEWPYEDHGRQVRGYEHVCRQFASDFDWIAFLDGDEFLVPERPSSLKDMLRGNEAAAAVAVGWVIFGSSGHQSLAEGLVTPSFLLRAHLGFEPNRHIKSIVRPRQVVDVANPHFFDVQGDYTDVTGEPVEWEQPGRANEPLGGLPWRVHHYMTRSALHWASRLQRRQPGATVRTQADFAVYDRNDVVDLTAAAYRARVEEVMATAVPAGAGRPGGGTPGLVRQV